MGKSKSKSRSKRARSKSPPSPKPRFIKIISSDGESFEANYDVLASESEAIKSRYLYYEEHGRYYWEASEVAPMQLLHTPSKTLLKVIEYCTKHADKTLSPEYLKSYDSDFVKLKPRILARLVVASAVMIIRSLMDLTCQALSDIINEMSPEDICNTLDINTAEFTPQHAEDMFGTFYFFTFSRQRLTQKESLRLSDKEKHQMNKKYFLQKVLPALPPAQFASLTPEEKKEWVLLAVYGRYWLKLHASSLAYDGNLDSINSQIQPEEESQTTKCDPAPSCSVKKSRNEGGSEKWVLQLFSACVNYAPDEPGRLYGVIEAMGDTCPEFISLFNRGKCESESQPICNNGLVTLTDPSPYGLISTTREILVKVQLFVRIDDDEDLKLSLHKLNWDCSSPRYNKNFGNFENAVIKTIDGSVKLYYMVLNHPVEATVELHLNARNPFYAYGKIVAYYGGLESYFPPPDESKNENQGSMFATFKCVIEDAEYCKVTLFEASRSEPVFIEDGKIPLTRSRLVVPYGRSLAIEVVDLNDSSLGNWNVKGTCEFESFDCNTYFINGLGCTMSLQVDWKRHA